MKFQNFTKNTDAVFYSLRQELLEKNLPTCVYDHVTTVAHYIFIRTKVFNTEVEDKN
jgi:hypothetical protein